MLTIRKENFREDEINVVLDGLVPKNHLVRKIENAIDLKNYWDDAYDIEIQEREVITYTDRFPKPDYIKEDK